MGKWTCQCGHPKILYQLAKSDDPWERRTAIVSTYAFIKKGQVKDTLRLLKFSYTMNMNSSTRLCR
ncbi:TPA: DNA alkylation repair protein [Streptococcus suis]|nr:DNA alkylation repair protein [Streptococcus suis]